VGRDAEAPTNATLHLPVARYLDDDAVVHRRVCSYLKAHELPVRDYVEPIAAFANRRLEDGVGMHSYASWRSDRGKPRVTLYLAPELFRVEPPIDGDPQRDRAQSLGPAEEIARYYERNSMADHPLFQRLQREPVDLRCLWLLLANARIGIVQGFARRLASVTARVPDERLRCLLAKQLNDELGNGDFTRAHHLLFDGLLAGLDRWRPAQVTDETLVAGRALGERLESIYSDPDPFVGVGAAMVIEIYGKQVDLQTGRELRRQHALDPESLTWLTLHEELELEHADESMEMARLIEPGAALHGAWRGARATCAASWAFFDDVYALCFG
jgi:pyrroloquinoline quinone (PQQ) biosynthesis protein C